MAYRQEEDALYPLRCAPNMLDDVLEVRPPEGVGKVWGRITVVRWYVCNKQIWHQTAPPLSLALWSLGCLMMRLHEIRDLFAYPIQ